MAPHPPQSHEDIKDRLHAVILDRCRLDPQTGCWPCNFTTNGSTPIMRVGGILYPALRVAAWVYLGESECFELEDGEVTVRRAPECRTKTCINFEHTRITRGAAAEQAAPLRRAA